MQSDIGKRTGLRPGLHKVRESKNEKEICGSYYWVFGGNRARTRRYHSEFQRHQPLRDKHGVGVSDQHYDRSTGNYRRFLYHLRLWSVYLRIQRATERLDALFLAANCAATWNQ